MHGCVAARRRGRPGEHVLFEELGEREVLERCAALLLGRLGPLTETQSPAWAHDTPQAGDVMFSVDSSCEHEYVCSLGSRKPPWSRGCLRCVRI